MRGLATLTEAELEALARGLARIYRGRVIPVISGGAPDDDPDDPEDPEDPDDPEDPEDPDDPEEPDDDKDEEQLSRAKARKLRRENQKLRQRAKKAEGKLTERERAELSDHDRAKAELQEANDAKALLESENRRLRVESIAARLGSSDPDLVAAAIDWDELGDDADRDSLESAVKDVKKRRPNLFRKKGDDDDGDGKPSRPGSADGGAGRPGKSDKTDDEDVTPGVGRLRRYYETATTKEK